MHKQVTWPAVVKFNNTDELLYAGSIEDWQSNSEMGGASFQAGDLLIDSAGRVYNLVTGADYNDQQQRTLAEVIELVRQHASVCGHCCVSKLGAPSIRDALQLVDLIE